MWKFIKQLFCKHDYHRTNWCECYSDGTTFSVREYRCTKCGHVQYTDSRKDTINK